MSTEREKWRVGHNISPTKATAARLGFLASLNVARIMATCNESVALCDPFSLRSVLPDAIDIFNHAGNASTSAVVGLGATILSGLYFAKNNGTDKVVGGGSTFTPGEAQKGARWLGIGAALAFNAYVEYTDGFTPDAMDFFYGLAAGGAAASMVTVTKVENPPSSN